MERGAESGIIVVPYSAWCDELEGRLVNVDPRILGRRTIRLGRED